MVCSKKETEAPPMWVRTVEPRLSGDVVYRECRRHPTAGDRAISEVQCGDQPSEQTACPVSFVSPEDALRRIGPCVDLVIPYLRGLQEHRADLAAAYFVRARRDSRASDLVEAFQILEGADERRSETHFNRALILQELGFPEDAIASWDAYLRLDDGSRWATEAQQHRSALLAQRIQRFDAEALQTLLGSGDRAQLRAYVTPYLDSAERYLEDTLLPSYAESPAEQKLHDARLLADVVGAGIGDSFPRDIVEATADNGSGVLRRAQKNFKAGRNAFNDLQYSVAAGFYEQADKSFFAAKSPQWMLARLNSTNDTSLAPGEALRILSELETAAQDHGYHHLIARIRSKRGNILEAKGEYLESLRQYDRAEAYYRKVGDPENLATVYARKVGVLRVMGQNELALHDALIAQRFQASMTSYRTFHLFAGEFGRSVEALGAVRLALLKQNSVIRDIERRLADQKQRDVRQTNLAIALRVRADYALQLGAVQQATDDLRQAATIAKAEKNAALGHELLGRISEVEGLALLRRSPETAVEKFSAALDHVEANRTDRARLLERRAAAHHAMGRKELFARDLKSAINELQAEQNANLQARREGEGEPLWSAYFLRFEPIYHRLVRHYVEEHDVVRAFAHAEGARAVEILQMIGEARTPITDIAKIRAVLPQGQTILQFVVTEDGTFTFIISREQFEVVTQQQTRREDVKRWLSMLQAAVRLSDHRVAVEALTLAYDGLFSMPLQRVRGDHRVIVVPDRSMQGLPFPALFDPTTRRFLIQQREVASAGSATLYLWSLERDRELSKSDVTHSVLLLGNPTLGPLELDAPVAPLRWAQREVEEIRDQYAGTSVFLRTGPDATAATFMTQAPRSTIIHVAAHAIANEWMPWRSSILLAPPGGEGGVLEAQYLIRELNLNQTKLVVLSACKTAGGLPIGPEGVAPLVRPLIAEGVPAVVGSLWDVNDDATTKTLMVSLHRHYHAGHDVTVALRKAQLEKIGTAADGQSSVLSWAAFQVTGHASSPFAPAKP